MILREANELDAKRLFEWRNDSQTRANSVNTELVTWEDHSQWLLTSLTRLDRDLLIVERDGEALGTVRIDYSADHCELSWTVAPEWRQRGIGKQMVGLAMPMARMPSITAKIKLDNQASQRIVRTLGFIEGPHHDDFSVWSYRRKDNKDQP